MARTLNQELALALSNGAKRFLDNPKKVFYRDGLEVNPKIFNQAAAWYRDSLEFFKNSGSNGEIVYTILSIQLAEGFTIDEYIRRLKKRFARSTAKLVKRKGKPLDFKYFWVKELSTSKKLHYHLALMADGDSNKSSLMCFRPHLLTQYDKKKYSLSEEIYRSTILEKTVNHPEFLGGTTRGGNTVYSLKFHPETNPDISDQAYGWQQHYLAKSKTKETVKGKKYGHNQFKVGTK